MSELNCSLAGLTLQLFLNLGRDNFFLLLPLSPSTLITLRHSIREDYVDNQPTATPVKHFAGADSARCWIMDEGSLTVTVVITISI